MCNVGMYLTCSTSVCIVFSVFSKVSLGYKNISPVRRHQCDHANMQLYHLGKVCETPCWHWLVGCWPANTYVGIEELQRTCREAPSACTRYTPADTLTMDGCHCKHRWSLNIQVFLEGATWEGSIDNPASVRGLRLIQFVISDLTFVVLLLGQKLKATVFVGARF